MRKLTARAPAKINLFLEVLPRPAGSPLHPVDTIVEKVTLFDRLTFSETAGRLEIETVPPVVPPDLNLVLRAARLMKETFRVRAGALMKLQKNIPLQAGLGGGSSDAAAALLTLNELWRIRAPADQLVPLAMKLGSDVPAFLFPGRCLVAGFGDRVLPLPVTEKYRFLLYPGGVAVSTATAFQAVDRLTYRPVSSKIMLRALENGDPRLVGANLFNRFEAVLPVLDRKLAERKRQLDRLPGCSLLSGSGGFFFRLAVDGGLFPVAEPGEAREGTIPVTTDGKCDENRPGPG